MSPFRYVVTNVVETLDDRPGTILASSGAKGNESIHTLMTDVPKMNISDDFMVRTDAK